MRAWLGRGVRLGALGLALLLGASTPSARVNVATGRDAFEAGVEAYRRGEYAEAQAHWSPLMEAALPDAAAARVAYDLGNAAWRQERALEAVGWYLVALRHAPRHADARANLELARSEAGLEPYDRGDLRSTVERLLGSVRPDEARALATGALALFALGLIVEVLLGGRVGRRVAWTCAALAALLVLPWLRAALDDEQDPMLVVRAPSVALRAEPRRELSPIGRVDAGAEVERIDALTGWVRIRTADGMRGWLQEEVVFPLGTASGNG